jgi:hypothetical protein
MTWLDNFQQQKLFLRNFGRGFHTGESINCSPLEISSRDTVLPISSVSRHFVKNPHHRAS